MAFMTASQLSQQYQSVLKPANKPEHEISQVTSTDDKYEVKLSINQFEPEELSVKIVDRYVHIEGRHEEKNDKIGFFTRQFTRRYFLPEGVQPEAIRCTFSVDTSILTVSAPIVNKKPVKELTIPIIVIGQQLQTHHNSQPEPKEKHHRQKQHQHTHSHNTLPGAHTPHKSSSTSAAMAPGAASTLPPPAVASTSTSSNSRRHHHHHHHHHVEKQQQQHLHHQHQHHYQLAQPHHHDHPSSQMNF